MTEKLFTGTLNHDQNKTDEALIAETMVWPNFSLMNVFIALNGSKLFIITANGCCAV